MGNLWHKHQLDFPGSSNAAIERTPAVNLDITQKLNPQDIRLDPFPYFYVENALPTDLYQQLSDQYPELHMLQDGKQHFQARRYRQHEFAPGIVSPLWQEFARYHNSLEFKNRMVSLFNQGIQQHYAQYLQEFQSADVIERHGGRHNVMQMEIQFVLNGLQETTVRTAHLDNGRELWAGLFYMRHSDDSSTGGDLQVFRCVKSPKFHGIREVDINDVEPVATLPYRANCLALFLNTPVSIHGVTPRLGANRVRRYINLTAHADKKLFKV